MPRASLVTALVVSALVALSGFVRQAGDTVVIAAHAVDNLSGDQVPDLTASDFVVALDRHDRPVSAVEFVHPATQTFVVVIDQSSFMPPAASAAREAVTRILDRAAPGDRIGLVAYPG